MTKSILAHTGMLAFAAMAMAGGMPNTVKRHPDDNSAQREIIDFGNYKHVGEIPKGCELVTIPFTLEKDNFEIVIEVDIVAATIKARNKKIIKYAYEVKDFVSKTHIRKLKTMVQFTVTEKQKQI